MQLTVLRMLSNNSLSAFSAATTTATSVRPSNQVRLVRDQNSASQQASPLTKNALPKEMPSIAPPRGSLLNLSV